MATHDKFCPLNAGKIQGLQKAQMAFYKTGRGLNLDLNKMQSSLDLPCAQVAASIRFANPTLKTLWSLLTYPGLRLAVAGDTHPLLSSYSVPGSQCTIVYPIFFRTNTAGAIQGLDLSSIIPSLSTVRICCSTSAL